VGDKKISEAVELLYKGAKMLAYHCPECKLPLFEKDNKIFCPSCGKEVVFEEDIKKRGLEIVEKTDTAKTDIEVQTIKKDVSDKKADDVLEDELERSLESAALNVCKMIVKAKSAEDVKNLTESLEKLINLIEKLRR